MTNEHEEHANDVAYTHKETNQYNWLPRAALASLIALLIVTIAKTIIGEANIDTSDELRDFMQTRAQLIPFSFFAVFTILANIARRKGRLSNTTLTTIMTVCGCVITGIFLLVMGTMLLVGGLLSGSL